MAALVLTFGFSGTAYADPNAETVTTFTTGTGDNSGATDETKAVDDVADTWWSTGIDGDITVSFDDNTLTPDGTVAADLRVRDRCGVIESVSVEISADGTNFVSAGATPAPACGVNNANDGDLDFDVDGILPFVTHVRVTDLGDAANDPTYDGFDIEDVVALSNFDLGTTHIHKDNLGAGTIEIQAKGASDDLQYFSFKITIVNGENEVLTDIVFEDVLPAEFDLDPVAEDVADGGGLDSCASGDGVCDGVMVSGGTAPGKCTATGAEHTNNGQSGKPFKLQPDIITILAPTLGDDESCEITVWAMTDQKSDSLKKVNHTPTSCNETTFIYLNEGVEVIDTMGTPETSDDVTLLIDDDRIELTCTGPTPL